MPRYYAQQGYRDEGGPPAMPRYYAQQGYRDGGGPPTYQTPSTPYHRVHPNPLAQNPTYAGGYPPSSWNRNADDYLASPLPVETRQTLRHTGNLAAARTATAAADYRDQASRVVAPGQFSSGYPPQQGQASGSGLYRSNAMARQRSASSGAGPGGTPRSNPAPSSRPFFPGEYPHGNSNNSANAPRIQSSSNVHSPHFVAGSSSQSRTGSMRGQVLETSPISTWFSLRSPIEQEQAMAGHRYPPGSARMVRHPYH